jgi:hypothetical protein
MPSRARRLRRHRIERLRDRPLDGIELRPMRERVRGADAGLRDGLGRRGPDPDLHDRVHRHDADTLRDGLRRHGGRRDELRRLQHPLLGPCRRRCVVHLGSLRDVVPHRFAPVRRSLRPRQRP